MQQGDRPMGMSPLPDPMDLEQRLETLCRDLEQMEDRHAAQLEKIDPDLRRSALNLLHYVGLRRQDLRPLQEALVGHGLSSLGRCESYVMANVVAVLNRLRHSLGKPLWSGDASRRVDYGEGRRLLAERTCRLFGSPRDGRDVRVMVTMPSEAADSPELVHDLVVHGMDCMRINCAHDGPDRWERMIRHLGRARETTGVQCRIAMDLGGPKLRTGLIEPGPQVMRWKPVRDAFGRVIAGARICLRAEENEGHEVPGADAVLPVSREFLDRLQRGDRIRLVDARGRNRTLQVTGTSGGYCWTVTDRTAYVTPGTRLRHTSAGVRGLAAECVIGDSIPHLSQAIVLRQGDHLVVTTDQVPGQPAEYDNEGRLIRRAQIGCSLPSVFRDVRPGERLLLDDGKVASVIREVHQHHLVVEVTSVRGTVAKLRADKGINLPDSSLNLDALTKRDLTDLDFVCRHADLVNFSFVRHARDVHRLHKELAARGRPDMGVILKIENRQGVEHLPRLMLAAMRRPASGVMIARGDLAVECGYERLAELQEEILWMAEAAHMPVVWATQVLEQLAREGTPSRAEITDAAMGVRAECVMLNKGPHIVEALVTLDDILRRMRDHQFKKRPMLRRLHLAADDMPLDD